MVFNEHKAIYLQIADTLCDKILSQEWKSDERIPSVRELAGTLGVNPNTVMRTYEFLQSSNIIYNKRGIGYFVSQDASSRTKAIQKDKFIQEELPQIFKKMQLLSISLDEMNSYYAKFCEKK